MPDHFGLVYTSGGDKGSDSCESGNSAELEFDQIDVGEQYSTRPNHLVVFCGVDLTWVGGMLRVLAVSAVVSAVPTKYPTDYQVMTTQQMLQMMWEATLTLAKKPCRETSMSLGINILNPHFRYGRFQYGFSTFATTSHH